MIEVRKTRNFEDWFTSLRDQQARLRVLVRIDRLAFGNPGQHRVLAGGVCEMKIDHGPGYRVYLSRQGSVLVLLLCGSDKSDQDTAIRQALVYLNDWKQRGQP